MSEKSNVVSLADVRKLVERKKASQRSPSEQELLDALEKLIVLADDHAQRLASLEKTLRKTLKLIATRLSADPSYEELKE
jgi:hypothetical protein